MPQLYQLADEPETYGSDAAKWIIVSDDGESELTGPMDHAAALASLERQYTVTWTIDVIAGSPEEAAAKARGYQHPDTTALVFEVADDAGTITSVDLMVEAVEA
ncbi:hypothetical protein [Brevundimonas sp.]|uniref:hypothetical protein n=1 Tax=Brevundimonas sp. TaxID=1871086 RepID=UPI002606DAF3|nr:hypothetical protein [Brevundimonas sp.]